MNRRGVIIILIISILIIAGFIYFNQFINIKKSYNLSEQYNLSNSKVLGYGVYSQEDIDGINRLIQESQDLFYKNNEDRGKIYFVFGNEEEVTLISYEQLFGGNVGVILGDKIGFFKIRKEDYKSKKIEPIERKVEMEIEGVKYTFNLKRTENSYFIIYKNEARELK
ncbi:MAG: hypothetical protein AABY22_00175 [Nanoarchaeota archaeon]